MNGPVFTPKKSKDSSKRYELQISNADHAIIRRKRSGVVTDLVTGQKYHIYDGVANKIPFRPRKYTAPPLEGNHVSGDLIREIAADYPEGEVRDEMLVMATTLDTHGWVEVPGEALFVTEAKLREIEAQAAKQLAEHEKEEKVPGFYAEWERTLGVYEYVDGGLELTPVITMFAERPAASDEEAAERFVAVAQEHGISSVRMPEHRS
jgi:hypothetical protein